MNPVRKRKLLIILFIFSVLSLTAALVLYALRQNISLFYTPTQIAEGQVSLPHTLRVGGMVEENSLIHVGTGLNVEFKITDFSNTVTVKYTGILPDLFREKQGVVVEGALVNHQYVQATRVLAKHDANYMPPEVKAALVKKVNS